MNKLLAGALAGLVATGPMTATMLLLHRHLRWHERHPLPPEDITEEVAHRLGIGKHLSEGQHQLATWVSHFGFGAMAGAIYAPLAEKVNAPSACKGIVFGLMVWVSSYLGWLPATKILHQIKEQPSRPNWLMVIAHIVWGATLGVLTVHWQENDDSDA